MSISSVTSNTTYYQSILTTNSTTATTSTSTTDATTTAPTTTSTQTTSSTTPIKWGFNVDKDGYFGVDFNKAAGLPENMKLNQKMMEIAQEYSNARGDNIDPLTIVSKVWNLYKIVAGNTFDPDGDGYMSEPEVEKMPYSYNSKGSLLDGVVGVQRTYDDYLEQGKLGGDLLMTSNCSLNTGGKEFKGFLLGDEDKNSTSFASCKAYCEQINGCKAETSSDDGKISTSELFSGFFYTQSQNEIDDYKYNKDSQYGTIVDRTKAYYEFLDSGQSIKDYMANNLSKDEINTVTTGVGTIDGKLDPNMVDMFFEALDKSIEEQRTQYKSNQYPSLDPATSKSTDNSPLSQISKAYQASTGSNAKLPSGSLISVGA